MFPDKEISDIIENNTVNWVLPSLHYRNHADNMITVIRNHEATDLEVTVTKIRFSQQEIDYQKKVEDANELKGKLEARLPVREKPFYKNKV